MKALPVREKYTDLNESQEFKVFLHLEGVKYEAVQIVEIGERL